MGPGRLVRIGVRVGIAVAVLATGALVAGCSPGSGGTTAPKADRTVVTYAEQPLAPPNFIFPFMNQTFFTVANSQQFQYLMYRPLYWFGLGTTPDLNPSLSLAGPPAYANGDRTVTIDLNPYRWSDGEMLTAENVLFWMNMLHSEKTNWAGYAPGTMPDDVSRITVDSPTRLTMDLTAPVNTYWFTYNELSQITPMPDAWDVTTAGGAPNSGGCATAAYGTADTACADVYTFLSTQAGFDPSDPQATNNSLSTYATDPLWQVVDGPYRLTRFDAAGNVTMVANPSYSGPVKPAIKTFEELPFGSESSEFDALVGGRIDVGYLPPGDVTRATSDAGVAGPNNPRLGGYTLDPLYTWSINYVPYNFNSSADNGFVGKIFRQLYVRQAFQLLVDQPLYVKKIFKGYAVPTYGPVPIQPSNAFVSSEVKADPYPYDPGQAVALLKGHGWKVVPGGTSTCHSPGTGAGQCGAGIPAGAPLAFDLHYASGNASYAQIMEAEKSSWASAGIEVSLTPTASVLTSTVPCSGSSCSWQLADWGLGWFFSPDYYPTGEELFQTGAGANLGSYSDPTNDANILATNTTQVPLTQYENYLAGQLPVIFQPDQAGSLTEIAPGLTGVTPQSPTWTIDPEAWRFRG
jgi:peptide/nickel transport system substrate-binding protein